MEPKRKKTGPHEAHSDVVKDSSETVRNGNSAGQNKQADWWSRADIISKFLSSVVIATVGLMITWTIQKSQQSSTESIASAQLEAVKNKAQDDKKIEQGRLTVELLQHLTSKDAAQREIAIIALRQSLPNDTYESIVQVLAKSDPNDDVRKAAIAQLGTSNNIDVAKMLNTISQDKSRPIAERALASQSTQRVIIGADLASNTFAFGASADLAFDKVAAGHGLFTYYLIKGLNGDADGNKDSKITAYELDKYLSMSIPEDSKDNYTAVSTSEESSRGVSLSIPELKRPYKPRQIPVSAFEGSGDETIWGRNSSYSKIVALIIGCEKYLDSRISSPGSTSADAESINVLISKNNNALTRLLIDPNKQQVMTAMTDLKQQIGPNDLLIVYFAGHGLLGQDGIGKWLVADSILRSESTYLSLSTVKGFLQEVQAKTKTLYIDACFSGIGSINNLNRVIASQR